MKVEEVDEDAAEEEQEEEQEEENWEKALSVERFGDIIAYSSSTSGERMGRHYTEKDFECKPRPFPQQMELKTTVKRWNKLFLCIHAASHV